MEPNAYHVVRADLDRNRDEIMSVWSQNLSSPDLAICQAKFAWQYRINAAGEGRCWLLVHEPSGKVVGTSGLGLRRICARGKLLVAGLATDFAVNKEHRFLQPALMLQKAVLESLSDGVDFIYGLPNTKALPVFKRLGYQGPIQLVRRVKVLQTEKYLDLPKPVRRIAGMAGDLVLRAVSSETWMPHRGRTVVELTDLNGQLDDLWQRAANQFPVICRRTAKFVQWRYAQFPLVRYTILGLVRDDGKRLDGYAVCHLEDTGQVALTDFIAADDESADDLLTALIRWARANHASSIGCEFMNLPQFENRLHRFGFKRRTSTAGLVAHFSEELKGQRGAELIQDWSFLAGDMGYL